MIVQLEGIINLENIKFKNLKNIKIDGLNWTGSINTINSSVKINDVEVISSKGEDAINLVNSTVNSSEGFQIHMDPLQCCKGLVKTQNSYFRNNALVRLNFKNFVTKKLPCFWIVLIRPSHFAKLFSNNLLEF